MMKISRRKLLRFAPASVAAVALGAVVLPKIAPARGIPTMAAEWRALEKLADPLLFGGPPGGGMTLWDDVSGVDLRVGEGIHIEGKEHVIRWVV